jgi:hypothetical protein
MQISYAGGAWILLLVNGTLTIECKLIIEWKLTVEKVFIVTCDNNFKLYRDLMGEECQGNYTWKPTLLNIS